MKSDKVNAGNGSKIAVAIFALLLAHFPNMAHADEEKLPDHLVLNTFAVNPLSNSMQTGMVDLLIKEAFRRINIKISIINLPAERALLNANEGIDDGDFVRIDGLTSMYPNLIKVPEKILDFEFIAFTKKVSIPDGSWNDIKSHSIGIIRGWKILEEKVQGSQIVTVVGNPYLLFRLLENERVDIIIYDRLEGYGIIKELKFKGITVIEPPLVVRPMFLYLNKKHQKLVGMVSDSLREIKDDGTYDSIAQRALMPFMPQQ